MDFQVILDFLNEVVGGISELWEILVALPAEVYVPALGVFLFVGILKALNVVGEDEQAALANVVLSLAANYDKLSEENAALILGATAAGAAALYKIWSRGIIPLFEFLKAKAQK